MFKCQALQIMAGSATLLFAFYKLTNRKQKSVQNTVLTGAIELGGTFTSIAVVEKVYSEIGNKKKLLFHKIIEKIKIGTEEPNLTILKIANFLNSFKVDEIGIASFGPLDLNKFSQDYGSITTSPKLKWVKYSILQELQKLFPNIKQISIDTDVNSCAQAEFQLGGHMVRNSLAYITVGTGVGVGLVINGKTVHGLLHPEGGHIIIPSSNNNGNCLKHPNCVEGYVTNNSIANQVGCKITDLPDLPDDHKIWDSVAECLAVLCVNILLICSPEVIIIGGGVMNRQILYPKIQQKFIKLLNGYIQHPTLDNPQTYIRQPSLKDEVGLMGAALLSDQI